MMISFIRFLLIFIEVISSLFLLFAILIQKSRGYGIGTTFGGSSETIFGAQLGTVLTKATVILAIIFLLNTALLAFVGNRTYVSSRSVVDKVSPSAPSSPAPDLPPHQPENPVEDLPSEGSVDGTAPVVPSIPMSK